MRKTQFFSLSMSIKNHHVMEITIGHSNHTSYENLLVQKCMFEHKYDMDCKQAWFTLIELKTYIVELMVYTLWSRMVMRMVLGL